MLRKTYDWVMGLAGRRHAAWALAALAFAEGLFFPIPPDVLLMPVVLQNRQKALRYALICTVCSILGGSAGYAVGYFLEPVGRWVLAITGSAHGFESFQTWYGKWGALLIALPIPYKITAIASGLAKLDVATFLGVSVVVRGLRFGGEALLLKIYGEPIRTFVERRLAIVASAAALVVIGLLLALKFAL
jgi:membrane protein YqaA with SNARE-associated domain